VVKVAIFGSDVPVKVVEAGALKSVLERVFDNRRSAEEAIEGYTVRLNGTTVDDLGTYVPEESLVTLVPEVKAG
jgi:predicted rRNA methylase YqxC with S4 and FtsJ domains